ncbi:phosphotransferase-like protein [Halioxenophilus sp. WMMB6]|uniref:phosphotransferase-like protein n=1 Tax=Halioxenophilus sp. WMMB6 TaxID=3073815 RepID=UPI00295F0A70|nr:AAA family ATPase [Halioxenophilus sp. WMMB6]
MTGQIIIINGTSGSGKSTTCELFAKSAEDFWLVYGIDHFLGSTYPKAYSHGGERSEQGIYTYPVDSNDPNSAWRWGMQAQALKAFAVFHEWVATAAREGCNIIVDHILLTDPPLLQDCIRRLHGLPVLIVTLKPDYEVLLKRVEQRNIGKRFSNSNLNEEQVAKSKERLARLRPWFYEEVYRNTVCDLAIDTVAHTPESVCAQIKARLAEGPGSAVAELARQFAIQ